ncbi:MAG: hypothetical protein J4400_01580 [Candidatus Aenigmarchaeota archaeon]|nr:hypothetical protein [Candidatus Aenigmarchaeota archaeon]
MNFSQMDQLENSIMDEYKLYLEKLVRKMSNAEFKRMLLQRKWTSYAFTPLYDFGIDGMQNEKAKIILRSIRNDEYPPEGPSHREDLVHDMKIMGMDIEEIINEQPSKHTEKTIKAQFDFLRMKEEQEIHDIKVVTFLRFALEILVSVEYSVFVRRLEDFGLNRRNSKFYWPHFMHDMKQHPLGTKGSTHSDMLSEQLGDMLDTLKKASACGKYVQKSYDLRAEFFRQKF